MTWFKVSDGLAFHGKAISAGNEAIGAWVRAGAWSSAPDNLTDGFIPRGVATTIAPARVWSRLIASGLVETPTDGRDGYQIHGFLDYNPSADDVRKERETTRKRVESWREKRRGGNGASNAVTSSVTNGVRTPAVHVPRPVPSRPCTDPPVVPHGGPPPGDTVEAHRTADPPPKSARKKPAHARPSDWKPSDAHRAKGRELGVDVDAEAQRFRDHHDARGSVFVDWDAAFRTWLGNEAKWRRERGGRAEDEPRSLAVRHERARREEARVAAACEQHGLDFGGIGRGGVQ